VPTGIELLTYAVIAFFVILMLAVLAMKSLRHICGPNEVLIFSGGRRRRSADGSMRGYNTVFGGSGWRTPIVGKVDRMSLNVMEVPIAVRNAYSKGGIALNVDATANVKISSEPRLIGNALERFLGRDPAEIRRVAKETLEGHLRGVLARLTPEEVNEDRLRFAEELSVESEMDLNKLGIHLDTLKIQHVSDERQYLDSIGREAIANVIREAEMTESDAKREAELAEAGNEARGNVMQANVQTAIVRLKNDLRRIQADLEAEVRSEEERTLAAAREARAVAEQELQGIRAELEGIRLRTDQILPAEAHRVAQEFRARGDAAILRERGLASSKALEMMNEAWTDAGDSALSIYLIEDIEKILEQASKGVQKIRIESLNMIDNGDGSTLKNYAAAYPSMLEAIFGAINRTTGIDIPKAISAPNRSAPDAGPGERAEQGSASTSSGEGTA
jgi:flotillin